MTRRMYERISCAGIAFTPDNAHWDLLKDARLAPGSARSVATRSPSLVPHRWLGSSSDHDRRGVQAFDSKDYAAARALWKA